MESVVAGASPSSHARNAILLEASSIGFQLLAARLVELLYANFTLASFSMRIVFGEVLPLGRGA